MFTLQRVGEIIDYFSVKQANAGGGNGQGETEAQAGRINVDTAPRDVLLCVSGIGEALADAIINQRARRTFAGAGGIVALEGVDEATFRKVYPCLTARSSRFHVWSRGVEPDSGATVTVEAVLAAADEGEVSIVYWRED
jgi:type II secretory pathway component PulK